MDDPLAMDGWTAVPPAEAVLPSSRRSAWFTFRRLLNDPAATPHLPSLWLETCLFYIRIAPCAVDAVPSHLTLSHLRREIGAAIEINGSRVPASDPTSVSLRRDRVDRDAAEVTYVSTDSVRIAGAVDFEVCDDKGNLVLCGSLERMEPPWSDGAMNFDQNRGLSDKVSETGWSMNCYLAASTGTSLFLQPMLGTLSPSIEVYVAGSFATLPVILTQTLQQSSKKTAAKPGTLDSIPEDEESTGQEEENSLSLQRKSLSRYVPPIMTKEYDTNALQSLAAKVGEEEADEYDSDIHSKYGYHPGGEWYSDEDRQLSWFNAGVRVGVGIGLGMCVSIGIGVGLLMRSYQTTTRNFKRRFL